MRFFTFQVAALHYVWRYVVKQLQPEYTIKVVDLFV